MLTGKVHRFTFWWRDYKTMCEFFKGLVEEVENISYLRMDNRDSFKNIADKYGIKKLVGKEFTRKLERFHLTIRTALARL